MNLKQYKIYNEPYLIGIAGDSSTGKTILSDKILDLFGNTNTLLVHGDDMHRWERGHESWNEFTHLHPQANWLHRDLSQLIDLKSGKKIMRRSYDHDTGKFTSPMVTNANKIIIYEGLHSFYLTEASRIYDLKIFLRPSEKLRRQWKIERDVTMRGHVPENVLASIEKRIPDAMNHILHQEDAADLVFSMEEADSGPSSIAESNLCLRIHCSNDIYFEHLLDYLTADYQLDVKHQIDKSSQTIIIRGSITRKNIREIAENLQLNIEEIIGTTPRWNENYYGIMQLFVLFFILTQFRKTGNIMGLDA